jgi:hypothetical protein
MSEEMMQESVSAESQHEVDQSEPVGSESVNEESSSSTQEEASSQDFSAADDLSNDNADFAKRRIDRKNKRRDQEIDELRYAYSTLADKYAQLQPQQQQQNADYYGSQSIPPDNYYQPQQPQHQPIVDPQTGHYLAPGTERYNQVMNHYRQQDIQAERDRYFQERESTEAWNEIQDSFNDSIEEAMNKYEDYENVVKNNQNLTAAMVEVSQMLPDGGGFLYYLAKNPKEMSRISRLHPHKQQKAVAAHAMKYAARSNVSSAPPVINHVQENSRGHDRSVANMSIDDLRAHLRSK